MQTDLEKWHAVVSAERGGIRKALSEWNQINDKSGVLRRALESVVERGSALRLLLLLGDDFKKAVFSTLVDNASTGHSDIQLCRIVIKSLPRKWILEHLPSAVDDFLARHEDDEEHFRRYAELYYELDEDLLNSLIARLKVHSDPAIREVAEDFSS